MALIKVVRGANVSAEAWFIDQNDQPLVGNGPVQWAVYDYYHNLVMDGSAIQDSANAALWFAEFSIPVSAPVSLDGERYQITWTMPAVTGTVTAIERFEVFPEGDPIRPINNTDVIMMENTQLQDSIFVNEDLVPGSLSFSVQDFDGDIVYDAGAMDTATFTNIADGVRVYRHTSPQGVEDVDMYSGNHGLQPYMGIWRYRTVSGDAEVQEFHPIYVVNAGVMIMADKLRKLIDRARISNIHKYLSFTDMDLVHFLVRGLDMINGFPPQVTRFSLGNVPTALIDLTIKAAAVEALRAQYLAEGMSVFNFTGQGTTLDVDRTQFLDNMANTLSSEVEANLKSTKRLLARMQGPGVLGISIGKTTNYLAVGSPWAWGQGNWVAPLFGAGFVRQ